MNQDYDDEQTHRARLPPTVQTAVEEASKRKHVTSIRVTEQDGRLHVESIGAFLPTELRYQVNLDHLNAVSIQKRCDEGRCLVYADLEVANQR